MRFLTSGFFMNQFPQAPEYTIWAVSNIFENSWRHSIFEAQGALIPVSLTSAANGKIFRKILIVLFGHLWVVELTYINFCFQVHFKVSAA